MSLQLSPQQRLGPELRDLCQLHAVDAGIGQAVLRHDGQVVLSWQWWANYSGRGVDGFAPSLDAARIDLRSALRSLGVTG